MNKFLTVLSTALLAMSVAYVPHANASNSDSIYRLNLAANVFKLGVRAKTDCRTCGYCRGRALSKGYLSEGGSYMLNTTLYRGYDYVIIGAGDDSVEDLDLEIYDENWNLANRDRKTDNLPVVKVSPKWTGRFHIRVKMYEGQGYPNVAICHLQPK